MLDIRNCDCMDLMKEYPYKHFDLAIVDPPYGININMNMGRQKGQPKKHKEKDWDNEIPKGEYFKELKRVSKNQIIWGQLFSTTINKELDILGQAGSLWCIICGWRVSLDFF